MSAHDIPVKCTRCRHQCMESEWQDKPIKCSGISATEKVCPKCGCKNYYDMRPQVAWCWASGLIEIGDKAPGAGADGSGAIVITNGPKYALYGALSAVARLGKGASAGKLLVPGVPEAKTPAEASGALSKWLSWCAQSNGKKHRDGVFFVKGKQDMENHE